jgi:hypothetical protein
MYPLGFDEKEIRVLETKKKKRNNLRQTIK